MKLFHKESKFKKIIKKPWVIAVLAFLALFTVVNAAKMINDEEAMSNEEKKAAKEVQVAEIDLEAKEASFLEAVGTVEAEAQIDVVANARGTLRSLNFKIGDEVPLNFVLASLYDNLTLTQVNNAQTNLTNMQSNLSSTKRLTEENIKQAELGVESAEQAVESAKIGLKAAQDNLKNAAALREKGNLDSKNSAVVSFDGFMNSIFSSLDAVNALLKINNYSDDILDIGLGAKKPDTLTAAKGNYTKAKTAYDNLSNININNENVASYYDELVNALELTEKMLASSIVLLDSSASTSGLPLAAINAQKANFVGLRSSVVSAESSAKSISQGLENLGLVEDSEISGLENAVKAAETQVQITETALENAVATLNRTKEAKDQQIISSESTLDNAQGQLNIARSSASDLYVRAPIAGKITGKYVDVGAEINIGQKIAQISQTEMMKIKVSLPSEDVYRVKLGQEAIIGDGLIGNITSIAPAADPITKKVEVEVLFDNTDNALIQGTFIDVSFPVDALEKTHDQAVFIPLRTVTTTQTESYVFTVKEGIARKTPVVLGKTEGALIEILSGLASGDRLVVEGGKNLEDGNEVIIN